MSRRHPDALVIGADQLLACGDGMVRQAARSRRGAAAASRGCAAARMSWRPRSAPREAGVPVWRATSVPELTMRRFSEEFLDAYLAAEGEALLGSVGAYRLEGRGVQLFSGISGDYFAILGLPLIELLGFLRERGLLPV